MSAVFDRVNEIVGYDVRSICTPQGAYVQCSEWLAEEPLDFDYLNGRRSWTSSLRSFFMELDAPALPVGDEHTGGETVRSDACITDRHDFCMGRYAPDWCGCECHVLLAEDLLPMTPEQVAWVRAQRVSGDEHTGDAG